MSEADHPQTQPSSDYIPYWGNVVTIAGLLISIISVILMLTFGLLMLISPGSNPYVDIIGYLMVPGLLAIGLVLMPLGILFKSWRLRRKHPGQRLVFRFPRVDLNDAVQRRAAKFVVGGTFFLLPVVGISSYHGYHYTDSTEFCARACHVPMRPQAVTYEHSAHARVPCAECHIGSGASWFVKSKLSGTRQVLAVWRNSFSRPIPPAIHHLRPARETCERCHWPKKFFGAQLREIVRFKPDEQNTRIGIDMLVNTGGGDETLGRAEGIHMHMALSGLVEYVATDERLQHIPWVRYVDKFGREWIYRSDGRPSSDPPPVGQRRTFDCMDCHNRPAHKFRSPQEAVDIFMDVGKIDNTLPYVKREAVAVLTQPYPDVETANQKIAEQLSKFYQDQYPDLWDKRKASVNYAIDQVREIYSVSFFPAMKANWQTYPDNIGHKISPGCFRCHAGKHVNQQGETITKDCNVCHTFLNPVERKDDGALIQRGEFVHPFELAGVHATLRCDQCHTGGKAPVPTCNGCHTDVAGFFAGTLPVFKSFGIEPDPMAGTVDCESCHDLSKPLSPEAMEPTCLDCHDDEKERFTGLLTSWKSELDGLMAKARKGADARTGRLLDKLEAAGPMHNFNAARLVLRKLATESPKAKRAEPVAMP